MFMICQHLQKLELLTCLKFGVARLPNKKRNKDQIRGAWYRQTPVWGSCRQFETHVISVSSLGTTYNLARVAKLIINICNEVRRTFFYQLIFTDSGYTYSTAAQLPCYMESSTCTSQTRSGCYILQLKKLHNRTLSRYVHDMPTWTETRIAYVFKIWAHAFTS